MLKNYQTTKLFTPYPLLLTPYSFWANTQVCPYKATKLLTTNYICRVLDACFVDLPSDTKGY